jgi:type II secretory ATPase GspE/PulE/Tfp pilus assembly ATPase PilB-like protein
MSERRKPQDGKIKFKVGEHPIELRVATLPTAGGDEDAVLRVWASSKPMPLEQMRLSDRNLQGLRAAIAKPYGLILCVGPTGSGQTTTLHSALGAINTPDMKIWTAEDPVEITQPGLRQVQANAKIGFTFAAAMRAFLRAAPAPPPSTSRSCGPAGRSSSPGTSGSGRTTSRSGTPAVATRAASRDTRAASRCTSS